MVVTILPDDADHDGGGAVNPVLSVAIRIESIARMFLARRRFLTKVRRCDQSPGLL